MTKLVVAALVAGFAVFAWWLLPSVPRPGEPAGGLHAVHENDPAALTDGVVVSVDRAAANVTISHGPVVNLGMPAMTMAYQVASPALLANMRPGDRLRFRADVVGGAFTVMSVEAAN